MTRIVWAPDHEEEADGTAVREAGTLASELAADYAERRFYRRDPFSSLRVNVRGESGQLRCFEVEVVPVPRFEAHEVDPWEPATPAPGSGT